MPLPDVRCPVCQAENRAGTRFCSNCGNVLATNTRGSSTGEGNVPKGRSGFGSTASALLAVLLLVALAAGGYWFFGKKSLSGGVAFDPDQNPWFRLHGSTTIGLTLAPRLAESFFHSKGATGVTTVSVPGPYIHFRIQGTLPAESSPRVIEVEAQGSGSGFTDLAQGNCDIAMSSREIKAAEIQQLSALGDFTERSSDRILGLDGVAVIVNSQNRLDEINLDDLARLFSGEYRQWSRLPGSGSGEIFVAARDEKSGTWETFRDLVLVPRRLKLDASQRFDDNAKLAAAVAAKPGAIGFVGMTYAKDVKTLRVGHPGLRALLPTRLTVLHEEYPLRRRLHLFVPSRGVKDTAALAPAREFCEFALSHDGQAVVDASGFVSEDTSNASDVTEIEELPRGYPPVMQGSRRVYTLFFRSGSADLEPLALDNVDRLTQLMVTPGYRSAAVFLVGHADNTGGHQANLEVSEKRVKAVRGTLEDRGVPVALAIPVGEEFPIEPNVPGVGNPRNRRVEVWIKRH